MGLKRDPMGMGNDYFTPKSINTILMAGLFRHVDESVKIYGKELLNRGWRFYVVNQTRGQCYYKQNVITIPAWVCSRKIEEKIWYISHEMAHAFDVGKSVHGDSFMQWLIKICPERCLHYELGYKPRNARRNGIGIDNTLDALGF